MTVLRLMVGGLRSKISVRLIGHGLVALSPASCPPFPGARQNPASPLQTSPPQICFLAKESFKKVRLQGTFIAESLAYCGNCVGACKHSDMRWNAGTGRSNQPDLYVGRTAYQRGYVIGYAVELGRYYFTLGRG